MQSLTMNKEFEEQFMQSRMAAGKTVPQPHEDFEPYLSQYSEYDSMLSESMPASVRELDISMSRYDDSGSSGFDNQMTITPASLAKYSKYLYENNEMQQQGAPQHSLRRRTAQSQMLTPDGSPVKSSVSMLSPDPQLSRSGTIMASSLNPYTTPAHSPNKNERAMSYDSESETGYYMSSPEVYSPADDTSPQMSHASARHSIVLPPNPNMSSSTDVYSSMDMSQLDPDNANVFSWQPIVTAPVKQEVQQILKMQKSVAKASSRKSCLPPGKVDSYLVGPNEQGMFECLYPNCGKFFRRRYNVRSHIQTHLCDRPYQCEDCGACFVRPHDLRRHVKCHQSDRPYVCPCGKAFTRHDALQRHRIRQICVGGVEIPGRPKRIPAKRGRPRKNPAPSDAEADSLSAAAMTTSDSESDIAISSPEDHGSNSFQSFTPYSMNQPGDLTWR